MLYLITYTPQPNRDNTAFYNAIQASSTTWWHYIDSTWIIRTNLSANEIYQGLSPFIGVAVSYLLVVKIDTNIINRQGWLPQEAWNWIRENGVE